MNHRSPLAHQIAPLAGPLRWLSILLMSAFLFSSGPGGPGGPSTVHAQSFQNEIKGVVVNGTEGGIVPADLEVIMLTVDDAAGQIIEQATTTVGADGTFSFGNLISSPGITFRVVANAGDYTPSIDLTNVDDWTGIELTIYDQTTSLDGIKFNSYIMWVHTIDAQAREAGILTVVSLSNTGQKVWVPDLTDPALTGLDLLRFNLPEGFYDLNAESGLPNGNILTIDTGFAMTNPIPPGDAAILMSYTVPYSGSAFDFELKLPYGADLVRVLLPDGGGTVTGTGFKPTESVVIDDSVLQSTDGNDYVAGNVVTISFTGLPEPSFLQSLSDFFLTQTYVIAIIWGVGLALLGILGYAMYSSRKKTGRGAEADDEATTRADVVAEIALLDEDFEAGEIDEDEYRDRRDELKQLALELDDAAPAQYQNYTEESREPEK